MGIHNQIVIVITLIELFWNLMHYLLILHVFFPVIWLGVLRNQPEFETASLSACVYHFLQTNSAKYLQMFV